MNILTTEHTKRHSQYLPPFKAPSAHTNPDVLPPRRTVRRKGSVVAEKEAYEDRNRALRRMAAQLRLELKLLKQQNRKWKKMHTLLTQVDLSPLEPPHIEMSIPIADDQSLFIFPQQEQQQEQHEQQEQRFDVHPQDSIFECDLFKEEPRIFDINTPLFHKDLGE